MGAMDPKERAAFMPMTDLKTYPKAMKPMWNNNGLSQGMFGSTFISGAKWKDWDGALIVGYAGIGIHGTPVGHRLEVHKVSADGLSSKATPVSWPTATGRFRSVVQGPDGDLYVALEDQGNIIRVTPE
jgi:glucose/arabinose dehydrogenase